MQTQHAPETHCHDCGQPMMIAALYQGQPITPGHSRHLLGTRAYDQGEGVVSVYDCLAGGIFKLW